MYIGALCAVDVTQIVADAYYTPKYIVVSNL